ncbi:MAG: response regulator [Pseudomonadota bacterium]
MAKRDHLEGKKILIVDDEPDVLETLAELLPMCDVVKASSFEEAEKAMNVGAFDIVVLDIMGVDGYKLLDIAREKKLTALMLTAHALSVEDTKKSFIKGAAFYAPKDEMANIVTFLNDVLDAQKKGKGTWRRWMERLEWYYDNRFGPGWQRSDKEFWDNILNKRDKGL